MLPLVPKSLGVVTMPRLKGRIQDSTFYAGFFQDMFWALLNSNEFILNH